MPDNLAQVKELSKALIRKWSYSNCKLIWEICASVFVTCRNCLLGLLHEENKGSTCYGGDKELLLVYSIDWWVQLGILLSARVHRYSEFTDRGYGMEFGGESEETLFIPWGCGCNEAYFIITAAIFDIIYYHCGDFDIIYHDGVRHGRFISSVFHSALGFIIINDLESLLLCLLYHHVTRKAYMHV